MQPSCTEQVEHKQGDLSAVSVNKHCLLRVANGT